jgi:alpha-L-fucosidase
MTLTRCFFFALFVLPLSAWAAGLPAPVPRVPSPSQLDWQRLEMTMSLHFGVNTFTDRERGDGKEDPAIFNPSALDARQ